MYGGIQKLIMSESKKNIEIALEKSDKGIIPKVRIIRHCERSEAICVCKSISYGLLRKLAMT